MAVRKKPEINSDQAVEIKTKAPEKPTTQSASPKKAAYYMYIGPSIRGVISMNAIIRQDELKRLDNALAKYPDIKHLLIPGDRLGAARIAIKKPDSFLAAIYNRLANKA